MRVRGEEQLKEFMDMAKLTVPVIDYRPLIGEFGSASGVAAALSAAFVNEGYIPGKVAGGSDLPISRAGETLLILGLGEYVSAMEITRI